VSESWAGTPYPLLRHLTLPVVAVTSSCDGRRNGMIANSAQRASLVPNVARISLYISKTNTTHDLVWKTGVFGIHLLRNDQYELIHALGFRSMRDVADKLADVSDVVRGGTGVPVIRGTLAAFECRVINTMDAGSATFYLGEVVQVHEGTLRGDVMTSPHFRAHAPPQMLAEYVAKLVEAQEQLAPLSSEISREAWPGPVTGTD